MPQNIFHNFICIWGGSEGYIPALTTNINITPKINTVQNIFLKHFWVSHFSKVRSYF